LRLHSPARRLDIGGRDDPAAAAATPDGGGRDEQGSSYVFSALVVP
jgi:hypothetical protein